MPRPSSSKSRNLEQDSLSGDPSLNTEVSVLNKINASNVLCAPHPTGREQPRLAALEQQVLQTKQQRISTPPTLISRSRCASRSTQNLASLQQQPDPEPCELPAPVRSRGPEQHRQGTTMNFFDAVLQAVNTLVQQNLGIFDGMGQNLFPGLRHDSGCLVRDQGGACCRRTSRRIPLRELRDSRF